MSTPTPPLLLGHRGSPQQYPENSLAGFQAALEAGLDGVELDVRRLKDGHLVVCHDPYLPDGRALKHLCAAQLPPEVPLLREVLAWAAGNGAFLNVELKPELGLGDGRTEETLDLIRAYGLAKRVIVSSFSPLQLRLAQRHAPEIARGLLYMAYPSGLHHLAPLLARRLQVRALHPHYRLVSPALMARAQQEGWQVNAWTVNDLTAARQLLALGVTGLIGDVPSILMQAGRKNSLSQT